MQYLCVYVYIHMYMYICVYIYIYIYTYIYIYIHTYITYTCISLSLCLSLSLYMYIYICICIYIYIYLFMYTHIRSSTFASSASEASPRVVLSLKRRDSDYPGSLRRLFRMGDRLVAVQNGSSSHPHGPSPSHLMLRGKGLTTFGRGDETVGDPHRAQIYQFELFKLILLSNLYKQFPVEQFEAADDRA